MSTLIEVEQAVKTLPLAEQETLFRLLAARFETNPPSSAVYRTRTHPGGIQPGLDSDKLGQLPEDLQTFSQ